MVKFGCGPALTRRELEVLELIVEGCTSAEIARRLYVSSHTVRTHRKNLSRKLNVHSIAALVRCALDLKKYLIWGIDG